MTSLFSYMHNQLYKPQRLTQIITIGQKKKVKIQQANSKQGVCSQPVLGLTLNHSDIKTRFTTSRISIHCLRYLLGKSWFSHVGKSQMIGNFTISQLLQILWMCMASLIFNWKLVEADSRILKQSSEQRERQLISDHYRNLGHAEKI